MSETDFESIAKERQRIKELIQRLEEKDGLLRAQQEALCRSLRANEAQSEDESAQSTSEPPPVVAPLEQPSNSFWGNDKVALVSYPRSGNSLLRRIIEKLTGITTGSDANPKRILVQQLAAMGMRGEGVMDSRVWCVKTHFPERLGYAKLPVKRAILIVRNPFDSIASFFQMMLTDSHAKSVPSSEVLSTFYDLWQDFLYEELSIWTQFHAHWRRVTAPMLTIRYEDLVQHREVTVRKIADFLYGPHLDAKVVTKESVEQSIQELLDIPLTQVGIYKPKSVSEEDLKPSVSLSASAQESNKWLPIDLSGGIYKALEYYTRDQFRHVLAAARSDLVQYGYWDTVVRMRPKWAPDLVPYYDIEPGGCMLEQSGVLRLNSRYALRPRYDKDEYGRGFDIRWEHRLSRLPKPKEGAKKPQKG